jgi:hypothetical protein
MTAQYAAGIKSVLKEAGFDANKDDDFKKQLKAFKAWQDTQKSEAEKAAEHASQLESQLAEATKARDLLDKRLSAIAKGVPATLADKYVKYTLAGMSEGDDFDKALDAALQDLPLPQPNSAPGVKAVAPTEKQTDETKTKRRIPQVI